MNETCSNCQYCIRWSGQTRCGRAETNYKVIEEQDEACKEFILYTEDDDKEP